MEYISIAPGMDFSRIIQGFWRLGQWNLSNKELRGFLEGRLERGVNTFDTAEIYGESESLLGKVLPELKRSDYKLVTKTGISIKKTPEGAFGYYDTRYRHMIEACKASIQRLKCEYIDLYLIHREDPLLDTEEAADAFKELKRQGLIREAGVSNFDPFKFQALNEYMDGELRTNQIEWNPCCFEHFESGMMDLLTAKKIHPMIWSPLSGGRLFTSNDEVYVKAREKFSEIAKEKGVLVETLVYAWIMYHPVGAMPLAGSSRLARLDNAIAALKVELEHAEWYELYVASGQKTLR